MRAGTFYSLKEVTAVGAVIPTGVKAATLETGGRNRKDKDRSGRVFPGVLSLRGRLGCRA